MDFIINIFNLFFFGPVVNLLVLIYKLLISVNIPGALGFAIIALTIAIRFAVWPFTAAQLKSAQKLASLKPHLDELKRKHKGDKVTLQRAQMALYKEHNINPAAGCLPTLIQIPIFIALYQSIINFFSGQGGLDLINSLLYNSWLHLSFAPDVHFLGLDLSRKPSDFGSGGILLILVPIITAALTFVQSKMTLPASVKHYKSDSNKETKEKEKTEDMMASVQSQMVYLMPIMIGYFAFTFPVGLAIYWNTFTILGIIQQYQISGWGGLANLWKKK